MSVSTILVICYYNGKILRTKTDVEYEGSETVITPLDIPVECTFQQLIDMIYSKTTIDKRRFKLILICKYPLRSGNRFQPFPVRDDSSVRQMLNLVNTTTIEEIKLYIKVVRVKAQMHNLTIVVGLVVVQYRILDQMEMMKTVQMKKVMMNMMKMLMMNVMEMMGMLKLMDMHHPFEL